MRSPADARAIQAVKHTKVLLCLKFSTIYAEILCSGFNFVSKIILIFLVRVTEVKVEEGEQRFLFNGN